MRQILLKQKANTPLISGPYIELEVAGVLGESDTDNKVTKLKAGISTLKLKGNFELPDVPMEWIFHSDSKGFLALKNLRKEGESLLVDVYSHTGDVISKVKLAGVEPFLFRGIPTLDLGAEEELAVEEPKKTKKRKKK